MAIAVIDLETGEQVNLIVADPSDPPPNGCELVELPAGFLWSQERRQTVEIPARELPPEAFNSGSGT